MQIRGTQAMNFIANNQRFVEITFKSGELAGGLASAHTTAEFGLWSPRTQQYLARAAAIFGRVVDTITMIYLRDTTEPFILSSCINFGSYGKFIGLNIPASIKFYHTEMFLRII